MVRSSSMAYVKKQFAKLDDIPGLYIKDIFCDKDGGFFSTLRHTTIKQQKTYHLIVGKIRKIYIRMTKGNPEELFWLSPFFISGLHGFVIVGSDNSRIFVR
jgi:hypothetical protein